MGRKRKFDPFEIDVVEDQLGEDFKNPQMIVQIRKVVDSEGNPNPIHWVYTDSGRKAWVAFKHAKNILKLWNLVTSEESNSMAVQNRVRPEVLAERQRAKRELTEKLQTYNGLMEVIQFVKDNAHAL